MSVTEILRGLGSWSVQLRSDLPQDISQALKYFGHITIHTGQVDPKIARDSLLASSRYTGVFRGRGETGDQKTLVGPGIAVWLGDEENKGYVYETPLAINHDFEDAIPLLLPPSVQAGTIFNVDPGVPFVNTYQYVTPREAIDYLCQTKGAEWRVNGNATLDAGLEAQLFNVIPKAAVVRRGAGTDMFLKALPGMMATDQDLNDFTTRTILLAEGTEGSVVTATADINPGLNPYKDLFGNAVKMARIISESQTEDTNAEARAQLQLNRFTGPRNAITMSTKEYDIKGDAQVGDYLWAFDPDVGILDLSNEIMFRGSRMWPLRLRLTEMTWPVVSGMSVSYRDYDGNWFDLTPWVIPESGDTTLTVGGYNRSLTGGDTSPGTRPPVADTSVPNAPTWNESEFIYSVYQSQIDGGTRGQVQLSWDQPTNVDGTTILDGDHYEIRYRTFANSIYPATHAQLQAYTHAQLALGTQGQPLDQSASAVAWQTQFVPFDEQTVVLAELAPNMLYEAQIRAVDAAKPPNAGDWSFAVNFQTSGDTLPPSTPAPPTVAAGRLNVQIIHTLGVAAGGTYNLERDLHHLEVHGDAFSNFAPDDGTMLGKILANAGMLMARVPLVGSVPIERTTPVWFKVVAVDEAGNKSAPSSAVQATAQLIDNAHISDLSVSKVTAGTITADWLISGNIRTALTGQRVEMGPTGIKAYNLNNANTVDINTNGSFRLDLKDVNSELRVRDMNNVSRFVVNNAEASIRDPLGNTLFASVSSAGWGITEPSVAYPFPNTSDLYTIDDASGATYRTTHATRFAVSHPKLYWEYYFAVYATATAAAGIGWSFARPPEFNPPSDVVIDATPNISDPDAYYRNGVYTWPTGMFGQFVWVFLFARASSGTPPNLCATQPQYLTGRGY